MNYDNLYRVFKNFNSHTEDYLGALYINVFNEFPRAYRIYYDENEELQYIDTTESFYDSRKKIKTKINSRKLLQNLIKRSQQENFDDRHKKLDRFDKKDHFLVDSIIACYSPHEYFIFGSENGLYGGHNFLMSITLAEDGEMANFYEELFCNPEYVDDIFNSLKPFFDKSHQEDKVEFGIAAIDASNSIYTTWYDYKAITVDIDKNYNDDFKEPYNRLRSIIETPDQADLIFLYGDPGTGKTTIIKHLISEYPDKEFIFIDGNLLYNASPEKLISYFLECQNTIFILEDCEKALMSRDEGYNPVMTTLLNLTDGIISDVLGIKIICTFNTNIKNIDQALLRKGRLSMKYEFKKLSKDKASILLGETATEDMTLADIYHYKEENDYSKKITKKIGF